MKIFMHYIITLLSMIALKLYLPEANPIILTLFSVLLALFAAILELAGKTKE